MNIYFFTFACALAGLLFGYDAGIISGAILYIKKDMVISATQVGLIVGGVPIGALFGALIIGKLSDVVGRKVILMIASLLFIFGSFQAAMAVNVFELMMGRLTLGVAIGASAALAPMYICEIATAKQRGLLVILFLIAINLGILLSYMMNALFIEAVMWRPLMVVGVIPALMLGVCAYCVPESPRWLMAKGKPGLAGQILIKLHGSEGALRVLEEINFLVKNKKATYSKLFQKKYLRIILMSVLVSVVAQAAGINAIIYYAPTIFLETGLHGVSASILATVTIGITYIIAALSAASLIDRVGRRKLLLWGLFGVIVSLILMTWFMHHESNMHQLGWLTLLCVLLFVLSQGIGVGPASFLIPAEVFPLSVRGAGMGVSIAANWLTNAVVLLSFPYIMHHFGVSFAFLLFLLVSIVGFFACYRYVPETKNASLEKIEYNVNRGRFTRRFADGPDLTKLSNAQ